MLKKERVMKYIQCETLELPNLKFSFWSTAHLLKFGMLLGSINFR